MFKKLLLTLTVLSTTAFAQSFPTQTAEVEAFLATHEVSRVTNYCRTDFLNCRSLIQYRSIVTGLDVESFEDRFMTSTNSRTAGFRGFFLKQADGTFNNYGQSSFGADVNIDTVVAPNQGISISFDSSDYPTFDVNFQIVGTDPVQYNTATLTFDGSNAVFTGDINFTIPFSSQTSH